MAGLIIDQETEARFASKFSDEDIQEIFGGRELSLVEKSMAVKGIMAEQKGVTPGVTTEPIFRGLFGGQEDFVKAQKLEAEQSEHKKLFESMRAQETMATIESQIKIQTEAAQRDSLLGGGFTEQGFYQPATIGSLPEEQRRRLDEAGLIDKTFGAIQGPPQAPQPTYQDNASTSNRDIMSSIGFGGQEIDEVLGFGAPPEGPRLEEGLTPQAMNPFQIASTPLTQQQSRIAGADLETSLATQRPQIAEGKTKKQAQIGFDEDIKRKRTERQNIESQMLDRQRAGATAKESEKLREARFDLLKEENELKESNKMLGHAKFVLEKLGYEDEALGKKMNELMELVLPRTIRLDPRARGFWEKLFSTPDVSDVEATVVDKSKELGDVKTPEERRKLEDE